jgi:glutamate synthase domain-containing protein 2/glutamate synthase domain-containing protein 1/glutamate synthase domain-containing protein 3
VARLGGEPSHELIERALDALDNLEHRGAAGADPTTGDGAGILLQLQHGFLEAKAGEFGVPASRLPGAGRVAIAMCFLPTDAARRSELEALIEKAIRDEGHEPLGWRDVPVDRYGCGETARRYAPEIRQLLIAAAEDCADQAAFERGLFVIRRQIELAEPADVYFPSFSSRTVVYKGMLAAPQLSRYYLDLRDPELTSALAIVHSRFSTNTFPSWALAHPYRLIAHNGEINTVEGNRNWMRAREAAMSSELLGDDLERCLPLIPPGASDSESFDRALELLHMSGRSLPRAVMMMVPRAYERQLDLPEEIRDFYRYHSGLMEPWDGPASVTFSDGLVLGAVLDRNGLRPGRWVITNDGWVMLSSEAGAFHLPDERVARRGRLRPGRLFMVDVERGKVFGDREVELDLARRHPYGRWYEEHTIDLASLPEREPADPRLEPTPTLQRAFGYTQEDLRTLLAPMANDGKEPSGSMGNDSALAVLSDQQPSLFSYFKQRFAQVTNPAIDPVREDIVMSLRSVLGPEGNLLSEEPHGAYQVALEQPILLSSELERLRQAPEERLRASTLDITWALDRGEPGLGEALERLHGEADAAIERGETLLVLSDRAVDPRRVPIPALLATSSLHHHLIRAGTRLKTGFVVESGEPREVHHMAALIGFGAGAINPYLMFESLASLRGRADLDDGIGSSEARARVTAALGKGLLKVLSKMGISTIQSYTGAQIFEAVGLEPELVERHFTGTPSRIGGIGLSALAREALARHARAYPHSHGLPLGGHVEAQLLPAAHDDLLPQGGIYAWRRDGERHMWDPPTIAALQRSVRGPANGDGERLRSYEEFSRLVNEENGARGMLRGLMRLRTEDASPIPPDEVEPVTEIVKRFCTGGMSLGALSPEAHETLAIAMNRLGGMSNSGEGGEDGRRYQRDPNGDSRRSAIKQVASARFGVTAHYLSDADQLQIKISQGSKPGEGGQLPGHKVDGYIAKLRFATPGVELISPPPHHDIYSIEDLKQLIFDLRAANPRASVSVKLAAEVGVGTVAAGVAKAGADHVVIAGHDGGTGASPLSSIQAAGVPWEIGLAETQQTLIENDLRSRIVVQADGQMRTGRDVVIAALLGADEFGFSTAPLIATGCIMMRVCHLNTCPVGIASQDPELRRRFAGRPEHVVDYLGMVAEDVRSIMAELGVARFEDLIGRAELLENDAALGNWKAQGVDLSAVLRVPDAEPSARRRSGAGPGLEDPDPLGLAPAAAAAIERGEPVRIEREVSNVHRAVGGLLSSRIARAHGADGLPEGTVEVTLKGSAGQSLGAWLVPGITIQLSGEANDYVGKGMSGGVLSVRPPHDSALVAEQNVIIGNVALYGATGGRAFFGGMVGERFAVRNSGARAVAEGVGDHACEYMTGGRIVVLGAFGRNFAAGMTGGIAYVRDSDGMLASLCNTELVELEQLEQPDREELHALVTEHQERTGSEVARRLLADWEAELSSFVKVMPRDYKRALAEGDELAASGRG